MAHQTSKKYETTLILQHKDNKYIYPDHTLRITFLYDQDKYLPTEKLLLFE